MNHQCAGNSRQQEEFVQRRRIIGTYVVLVLYRGDLSNSLGL